ncbi:TetR/AcrR family transcriptional regulator [Raoultibacter phocaeensis]|uniref:TetR/AcrR family transcriptional regulator n=1 Tax=Raoultibacter phocaeensis TaxID=2479841 RepID=UPI00111A20AD|nr:TetR/AcrR family transcriptional regulator [Raoultibacter phocaeensis]
MARRVKEPPEAHRNRIGDAAEKLFSKKGIQATSVEDIAREAGYSKATLYVYFVNKEDIVGFLTLKSMRRLQERLHRAVHDATSTNTRTRYDALCAELTLFYDESPLYFDLTRNEIPADFERPDALDVEREIYEVGECINDEVGWFIEQGIARKELRDDLPLPHTVFLFWASLSGLVVMASKKATYFEQATGMSKQEFLEEGFDTLYHAICTEGHV